MPEKVKKRLTLVNYNKSLSASYLISTGEHHPLEGSIRSRLLVFHLGMNECHPCQKDIRLSRLRITENVKEDVSPYNSASLLRACVIPIICNAGIVCLKVRSMISFFFIRGGIIDIVGIGICIFSRVAKNRIAGTTLGAVVFTVRV
jgi:hypothetical protein